MLDGIATQYVIIAFQSGDRWFFLSAEGCAERLAAFSVRVTRIATGVPMGGDLKYVDQLTLRKAMETRNAI